MSAAGPNHEQREFRCSHCNGKILIPKNLPPTTGPCPHCAQTITSPGLEVAGAAIKLAVEVPVVAKAGGEVKVPEVKPVAEVVRRGSVAASVLPDAERGVAEPAKVEVPLAKKEVEVAAGRNEKVEKKPKKKSSGLMGPLLVMLVLILLAGGLVVYLLSGMGKQKGVLVVNPTGEVKAKEMAYVKSGWQEDARRVLAEFLEATTTTGKAAHSLMGASKLEAMEAFYRGRAIDDSDTPASAFSVHPLTDADYARGIFMLEYDQPPMFELREFFRPLAPVAVTYGVEEPDMLLSAVALASNFATEPIKVHALFKKTPEGLRLDWDTFVQTKYRTMRTFIDLPEAGKTGVFRVLMREDVPERGRAPSGTRTYLVADPAYNGDSVRVNVPVDSELGNAVSKLNYRDVKGAEVKVLTATVELGWSEGENPVIELRRLVCWEFLGLGGQAVGGAGNSAKAKP